MSLTIFQYDRTFDGMLTAVFDAYARRTFPQIIQGMDEPLPLFHDEVHPVITDEEKASRVWRALEKKLSKEALSCLTVSYLSELPELDLHLFNYICKNIDSPVSLERNFADDDIRFVTDTFRKVLYERLRMMQFLRFQKAADGTYFGIMEPQYNVLPLAIAHFKDRFADQPFVIYDKRRHYGYYYDQHEVTQVTFDESLPHFVTGQLDESLMADDEKLFQDLWRTYFKSICIRERLNPRKQRKDMPVRYWKYLTEKNR
ncbi:TIGR03915 family putative DNA repair protein [Barnesiella viscericola]|uniref:TIGR03915 family putative DNA repair protein n=1 Tax=Barnesiella viscericola TaxID=397865 RepID=UPI0023564F8D|nr:TIGR03915 family putative DNA repair protein [Barnesiella viscericola]